MSQSSIVSQLFRAVCLVVVVSFAWFGGRPALAQGGAGSAQDRAALLRTQVGLRGDPTSDETGTDSVHAVASPNDPDLGEQAILKRTEDYQPFTFFAALPLSYTSNAALARRGAVGDTIFSPLFGFGYAPRLTKTLFLNLGVGQQLFYYDASKALNFASFDVRAGVVYIIPRWHNLVLRADYDFNRLSSLNLNRQFLVNHSLNFGAEMPFRIGRAQQVTVGTDLSFSVAACPDPPARHDFSGFVGYSLNLTRDLTMNAVARLAVRDYVNGNRTDVSGVFLLGAVYRLDKFMAITGTMSFATNDSNQDVFSYDVFNIGGALALNVRF